MKRWKLENLAEAVEKDLLSIGLAHKTLQAHHYYGTVPIARYYANAGRVNYSGKETWKCVLKSRDEFQKGEISYAKFRQIRKTATLLDEYATTGALTWRTLPQWNTRQLTNPFAKLLEAYVQRRIKAGHKAATIRGMKPVVKWFLHYLEERRVADISKLSREDVLEYLPIVSKSYSRTGEVLSIMRGLLTFLHERGFLAEDLSEILRIATSGRRKYHFGFTKQEASRILSAINRNTSCGKRDYAILMLAVNTGLRAIDVLGLQFKDMDWERHELRITQHKTQQQLVLPLSVPVCNAIAEYILSARPKSGCPYIFLRDRNPHQKLESWSGCAIVKRAAAKAGIQWSAEEWKGFHSFRRSIGNWMLEAEIPLGTISEILGHSSVDSTRPYIMTHVTGLAMCALPLHGIETGREELR